MIVASCLMACNSIDKQLAEFEKAIAAQNLEKAEQLYDSFDVSKMTTKQSARWTEATMKYSALQTRELLQQSARQTQELMDQSSNLVQEMLGTSGSSASSVSGSSEWNVMLSECEKCLSKCESLKKKVKAHDESSCDTFDTLYKRADDIIDELEDVEERLSADQLIKYRELAEKLEKLWDLYAY